MKTITLFNVGLVVILMALSLTIGLELNQPVSASTGAASSAQVAFLGREIGSLKSETALIMREQTSLESEVSTLKGDIADLQKYDDSLYTECIVGGVTLGIGCVPYG
jgi:hypothetical protein